MTDSRTLASSIDDLRAQIDALDPADTTTREHLTALLADVEKRVGTPDAEPGELGDSLNASVLRFEASHPTISTLLNQLAEKLGTMGI